MPPAAARTQRVELGLGQWQTTYLGAAAPVDEALAALAGKYAWVEWVAPGGVTVRYVPGVSTNRPIILSGASVTIFVTEVSPLPPVLAPPSRIR